MEVLLKMKDKLGVTAKRVLDACKLEIEVTYSTDKKNINIHVPSGDMKYRCFWIRDAAMMADSGLIPAEEIKEWLRFISFLGQNGSEEKRLNYDLSVPAWAVADHITFEGLPIFYPGVIMAGKNQGNGTFGFYPPHDNQYYFIKMAYLYYQLTSDLSIFYENMAGMHFIERLEKAFLSYNIDKETDLCVSVLPHYTVDWGFCDTIIKSGFLLFPSLLRYQASIQIREIFTALGDMQKAGDYERVTNNIRESIFDVFYQNEGWFISATEVGAQIDIWGTAFAVWIGLLPEKEEMITCYKLLKAYHDGKSVDRGYVRHILVGEDEKNDSAWERATCANNTYQNGGYWATPTGWYLYALAKADMKATEDMTNEFIKHIMEYATQGSPFEWRSQGDKDYSGRLYGISAALPYSALLRIIREHS